MMVSRGSFRGSAVVGAVAVMAAWSSPGIAGTYTVVHQFSGYPDGNDAAGVTLDAAGNLYGETMTGGAPQGANCGTVFKITPAGVLSTLINFPGSPGGCGGSGGLLLIKQTLYGSTRGGGSAGQGLLFSIHTDGSQFTVLHSFTGADGAYPVGTQHVGADHALYGVTQSGGSAGLGVLYKLQRDGTFVLVHQFTGGADGEAPTSLVGSATGTLFGATGLETGNCSTTACGVVFEYAPNTGQFSVPYSFTAERNGSLPYVGSVGPDGTVYGATYYGGTGDGTLFQLKPVGSSFQFTRLYSFTDVMQGADPDSGPAVQSDGSLLGVTNNGGTGRGTLYSFSTTGVLTTLYSFVQSTGGAPAAQPVVGRSGTIYGTTALGRTCTINGQTSTCGVVYSFQP